MAARSWSYHSVRTEQRHIPLTEEGQGGGAQPGRMIVGVRPLGRSPGEIAGADEHGVSCAHGDALALLRGDELVGRDGMAGLEPRHAVNGGNVQQDAPGDDALGRVVDRQPGRASYGAHIGGVEAVVVLGVPREVGQAVEVSG
jgi:hypothetical protein